ncbi:MAG: hypothetical protein HOP14_06900 [Acidobacteria bacterium]|nr:hypothetical protein [Acidobacteriota bacterium]
MSDIFLGVIALSVLTLAVIQVGAIVYAMRAARRVESLANRLEQELRPVMASLQAMSSEAVRATSVAAAQVDRVDQLFGDVATRVEQTAAAVQAGIMGPAREGIAVMSGLRAALGVLRDARQNGRRRPSRVEDEDALFIG